MRFLDLTPYGKIIAGLLIVIAFILGVGLTAVYLEPANDPWPEALKEAGYDANTVAQLIELPNGPMLKTDSLGFQQATGAILYREVDENGEPLIAVYYLANKVILNNLPQPRTPESLAGQLPTDRPETGEVINTTTLKPS